MPQPESAKNLTEPQRREIFLALVEAQDRMPVGESRKLIAKQFSVTDSQLKQIEREGLEGQWPPL
ncbi:MAG: hypothetical protein K2R98_11770 [Gemmataceae bacterium]|nr:hypothetical protein [Gemmataceae bacterium]